MPTTTNVRGRWATNGVTGPQAVKRALIGGLAGWPIVTFRIGPNGLPATVGRRQLLRMGALAAVAVPLAGCAAGYDDTPDPLEPLARAARADAKAARALPDARLAKAVARVRLAHAEALAAEVRRANRPAPSSAPVSERVADLDALGERLATARRSAAELLTDAPRHRAGLLGAVAAGCAAAQALSPRLGAVQLHEVKAPAVGEELPEEATGAMQQALDAEYAAVWAYGFVAAYLPAEFGEALDDAGDEHRERRDALLIVLDKAGVTPRPAEPAYVPPDNVRDAKSGRALVITAESDLMAAWRGVLERSDDGGVRRFAGDALVGSAVRCTRWRAEAGITPSAIALPGQQD